MLYVKNFLKYLLRHIDLVIALHQRFGSMSFNTHDFMDVARSVATDDWEQYDNLQPLLTDLLQREVLLPVPRAEYLFDLNPYILDMIELLTDQEQLALAATLKAEIHELTRLTRNLGQSFAFQDSQLVQRYISQLDRRFRGVHRQLQRNEQAIMRIIETTKNTATDSQSLKGRYAQALDTWEHYIQPSTEMLDTQGDYEQALKQTETLLLQYMDDVQQKMGCQHLRQLQKLHYRLLDLRSGLRFSIARCQRLLEPIYRRQRRNSILARGASMAIAEIRQHKFKYAATPNQVALIGRNRPSIMESDHSILAYLSQLTDFEPPAVDIPEVPDDTATAQIPITFKQVQAQAINDAPIDDCMTWLLTHFPELDTRLALEYFIRLTNESEQFSIMLGQQSQYETNTHHIHMQCRSLEHSSHE